VAARRRCNAAQCPHTQRERDTGERDKDRSPPVAISGSVYRVRGTLPATALPAQPHWSEKHVSQVRKVVRAQRQRCALENKAGASAVGSCSVNAMGHKVLLAVAVTRNPKQHANKRTTFSIWLSQPAQHTYTCAGARRWRSPPLCVRRRLRSARTCRAPSRSSSHPRQRRAGCWSAADRRPGRAVRQGAAKPQDRVWRPRRYAVYEAGRRGRP
jgi:hypothetical protein